MQVEAKLSRLLDCLCFQGSVAQLREVWEETDGLDPLEFNPKTFFKLHGRVLLLLWSSAALQITDTKLLLTFSASDTNDDKVLDEQELEALFTKEVRNVQKNTTAAAGRSPPPDSNLSRFLLSWRRFTTPRMKKMT